MEEDHDQTQIGHESVIGSENTRPQGIPPYNVESAGKDDTEAMLYAQQFGNFFGAPYSVLGVPLTKVLADPTFKLLEARSSEPGGVSKMEIAYQAGTGRIKVQETDKTITGGRSTGAHETCSQGA